MRVQLIRDRHFYRRVLTYMLPVALQQAINMGVNRVVIMDGRVPHSILMETLTDEGAGTMVTGG